MKILKVVCIKKESLDKDVFYPSDFSTQDLYVVKDRLYIRPHLEEMKWVKKAKNLMNN